jgi:nucleoside-diphosphate-sugar epimerase
MQYWKTIICDKKPEDVVGETFHAVYGKEYSVIEMAEEVCRATGMGLPVTSPIYEFGERVENEPVRSWMVSLKDNLLGVKPQFDLHNGLMRTIPDIYFRTRDNGTKQTISDDIKHNTGKTPVQ